MAVMAAMRHLPLEEDDVRRIEWELNDDIWDKRVDGAKWKNKLAGIYKSVKESHLTWTENQRRGIRNIMDNNSGFRLEMRLAAENPPPAVTIQKPYPMGNVGAAPVGNGQEPPSTTQAEKPKRTYVCATIDGEWYPIKEAVKVLNLVGETKLRQLVHKNLIQGRRTNERNLQINMTSAQAYFEQITRPDGKIPRMRRVVVPPEPPAPTKRWWQFWR